jgi:hypothetical protein
MYTALLLSYCLTAVMLQSKLTAKAPFKEYSNMRGLKVHWGSPVDYSTYPEGPFDVVYDNNGKDLDSCKPLIDAAKVCVAVSASCDQGPG